MCSFHIFGLLPKLFSVNSVNLFSKYVIIFPGITSKAELRKTLMPASSKLASDDQGRAFKVGPKKLQSQHAQSARPNETFNEHKYSKAVNDEPFLFLLEQDKQADQVTLLNKLILKAVQEEISKLKRDGILQDAFKSSKRQAQQGLAETPKTLTQKPNQGNSGVTKEPSDRRLHLGLRKGYHKLGLNTHSQKLSSKLKPVRSKDLSSQVPIFQNKKGSGFYVVQGGGGDATGLQEGGQHFNGNDDQTDKESNDWNQDGDPDQEIIELIKAENNQNQKDEQRIGDVDDVYNEGKDVMYVVNDDGVHEGQKRIGEIHSGDHEDEQLINAVNDKDREGEKMISEVDSRDYEGGTLVNDVNDDNRKQVREPEFRDSYSPKLVDEIKKLGLNEYYIKDGFETWQHPKRRKIVNGQVSTVFSKGSG